MTLKRPSYAVESNATIFFIAIVPIETLVNSQLVHSEASVLVNGGPVPRPILARRWRPVRST